MKLSSVISIIGLFAYSKFTEFEQNCMRHLERAYLACDSVEFEREVTKTINYLNSSGLTHENGNGSGFSNELRVVVYRLNHITRRIEGGSLSLSAAKESIRKITFKKDAWTKLIGDWFNRNSLIYIAIATAIFFFVFAAAREFNKRE